MKKNYPIQLPDKERTRSVSGRKMARLMLSDTPSAFTVETEPGRVIVRLRYHPPAREELEFGESGAVTLCVGLQSRRLLEIRISVPVDENTIASRLATLLSEEMEAQMETESPGTKLNIEYAKRALEIGGEPPGWLSRALEESRGSTRV